MPSKWQYKVHLVVAYTRSVGPKLGHACLRVYAIGLQRGTRRGEWKSKFQYIFYLVLALKSMSKKLHHSEFPKNG